MRHALWPLARGCAPAHPTCERKSEGSHRLQSSILSEPVMHFAAVPQVQMGRQAALDCNPAYPSRSFCGPYRLSGQLCPQPFLHQFAQGAPQLDSAFLGLDKQIIRQFDGGLFHTGNHNTIIMYETGAGTWLCCPFGNRQGRRGYFAPKRGLAQGDRRLGVRLFRICAKQQRVFAAAVKVIDSQLGAENDWRS